jgi:hypothetical protein
VISHSFAFNASRHLSTLVSMLDLSPPLPTFLLLCVGGLSRLNTRALPKHEMGELKEAVYLQFCMELMVETLGSFYRRQVKVSRK